MSFEEKFDSAKDKVVGKAKEFEGKVTGDKSREAEGKAQGFVGKAKEVVSDVKDAVKDAVEDFKEDNKK
ncbi:CsbD family protein [Leuconostoc palmae]|uniref:CsbD family protein n=1 Tax=Leuconostoc palmae TaxID=501487 RepID=UPI001C7CA6CE|nr:CsbD family protein [Leuconostoc palmae]